MDFCFTLQFLDLVLPDLRPHHRRFEHRPGRTGQVAIDAPAALDHVDIRDAYAEQLPVEDDWADVIISNGVFNLMVDKPGALAEMRRVLKPGGRLQIADILVQKAVPEGAKQNIDLWKG